MRASPLLLIVLLSVCSTELSAQRVVKKVHQLSGLVLSEVDKQPLPYTNIWVQGTGRGATTGMGGFFSLVVQPGDTLRFSSIGYKTHLLAVPDTLRGSLQSIAVYLVPDTVLLDPVYVYPWPSPAAFKRAFGDLQVSGPEDEIASYSGFRRIDDPKEPEPTVMNPASLFYEKVVKSIKRKKRKRKKSKQLPKME